MKSISTKQPATAPSPHPALRPLTALLIALVVSRLAALYSFGLYDDAFITFRFVENLVSGQGFLYNIGERVQGISTPLWGLLLALPTAIGVSPLWSARLLGLLVDLALAMLVYRALLREQATVAAQLTVGLFALDLYLTKTATSGMESSLFLGLTLAAMLLLLRNRYLPAAISAALSVFVRPEGALFAAVLLAYAAAQSVRGLQLAAQTPNRAKPNDITRIAIAALLGVAVVVAGATLQRLYYGTWIPQSVAGKAALPNEYAQLFTLVLFPLRDPLQFLLTITTLLGIRSAWRASPLVRVYTPWAALLLLAWIVTGAHLWAWYCVPVWFYKVLVTGVAGGIVIEKWELSRRLPRWSLPVALAALTVVAWIGFAAVYGRDRMETHVYSQIRHWASGKQFAGMQAYGMDFGAFGYYTGMRILDEPALVWPAAVKYHHDLRQILLAERPEYAYVTANRDNIAAMRGAELSTLYEPLWRASMRGDTDVNAPAQSFVADWAPDFVLFARRDMHAAR